MNIIDVESENGKLRGIRNAGVNIFKGIPYSGRVSGDTSAFAIDFAEMKSKLEPFYGPDTKRIIETYRKAMPDASAPDIFVAISSIVMMGLGSIDIAEKKAAQNGASVYLYYFGYKSKMKIPGTDYAVGTPHAMDISFKFNNETPGDSPGFLTDDNPDRFTASHNMAELWANFARTGKPFAAGVPEWREYNLEDRPSMRIDTKCEVIHNRFSEELDMWRSIGRL